MSINNKSVPRGMLLMALLACGLYLSVFVPPSSATLSPGVQAVGNSFINRSVWNNVSLGFPAFASDWNQTDEFFACGNNVTIRANVSCYTPHACNTTELKATANFTGIGLTENGGYKAGRNVSNQSATGTIVGDWMIFEFNALVNCTAMTITNFESKDVYVNVSILGDESASARSLGWTSALLVNMSRPPGCPPAGSESMIPSAIPLLNGTLVTINTSCSSTCTVDNTAQSDSAALGYAACGPNFAGDSVNFTNVSYMGNFSNVNFTLDIPGKVRLSIPSVNISDQYKMNAIFQFAMKNMMSGGRVGVNETEWNGSSGKPDLRFPARLTIYNFTGRFGFPSWRVPVISRRATYGVGTFGACNATTCGNTTWDGTNLTFTVSGFSEYQLGGTELSVVLSNVSGASFNITTNTSYNNSKIINFSYVPTWSDAVGLNNIKNATLWGNFTSGTAIDRWAANNTNATPLVNGTVNWLNVTVNVTGAFKWNVVVFDIAGANDTNTANWTYIIEQGVPFVGDNTVQTNATITAQGNLTYNTTNATNQVMYAPGARYMFNLTASDGNYSISKVLLDFSNNTAANYTATRIGSTNNYSVVMTDLNASNYVYRWFANDSAGNWNTTVAYKFNVTQNNTAPLNLLLNNNANQNITATYPEPINATILAQGIYTAKMWLNGTTDITALAGAANINVGVGVWNITVNTTSTINYTANATGMTYNITVFKGLSNISLFIGGGTGTEGNASIAQGSTLNLTASINTSYSVILELNATLSPGWADKQSTAKSITNTSNATHYTAASNYNITAHFAGDLNYTGDTQTWLLNVTVRTPTTTTAAASGASSSILSTSADKIIKSFTSITPGATKTINEVDLLPAKTGLTEVQLLVKERVTSVEMTVESIAAKPSTASTEAAPSVYKYMSISFSNVAETNVQSAKVSFKVAKSWLTSKGMAVTDVALYRLSGGAWTVLPTSKTKEDTLYAYYEATTPGFSYFAIGGQSSAATTTTVPSGVTTTTVPGTTVTTTQPGATTSTTNLTTYVWIVVAVIIVALLVVWKFKLVKF